jgi:excisionase family DNA binding protein
MEEKVILITTKKEFKEILIEMFSEKKYEPSFEKEKMTVAEGSKYIDVSYVTLCKWINDGKIPVHGKGRKRFLYRSELVNSYEQIK